VSAFLDSIKDFSISDDPTLLLGPEVVIAKCNGVSTFYAYAYRDIFDKKVEQKILCFYVSGFPNVGFLFKTWVCIPKAISSPFKCLFVGNQDRNTDVVERVIVRNAYALTMVQQTADWFTLRAFHVTATMASRILHSTVEHDDATILQMLLSSWFNRMRSMEEMRIGSKNEDAVLMAFTSFPSVTDIFQCGLFESKVYPWLAASPDGIAIIMEPESNKKAAVVEIKTRVSLQRILAAEEIHAKYNDNKIIETFIGSPVFEEVVEKDHATQLMMQMSTVGVDWAVYIVAKAGTQGSSGRIIYAVLVHFPPLQFEHFIERIVNKFGHL
jgi:hypothetical protein